MHRPQHGPLNKLSIDDDDAGVGLGKGIDHLARIGDLVGVGRVNLV